MKFVFCVLIALNLAHNCNYFSSAFKQTHTAEINKYILSNHYLETYFTYNEIDLQARESFCFQVEYQILHRSSNSRCHLLWLFPVSVNKSDYKPAGK